MSGQDPQQPSQPSQQSALNQGDNPADKTSKEESTSQDTSTTSSKPIDHRSEHDVPSTHSGAPQSTTLGSGDTGPLKQRDTSESDAAHSYSADPNVDGEQMRAPGEGEVAQAVKQGGGGGHGEEQGLTQNLDAKTKQHEEELHQRGQRTGKEIEEEEHENWTGKKVDINEALGGRETKVLLAPEGVSSSSAEAEGVET